MSKYHRLFNKLKKDKIGFWEAVEELTEMGNPPNILNDGKGNWLISFDCMQNVSTITEPIDVKIMVFIEIDKWSNNLKDALINTYEI